MKGLVSVTITDIQGRMLIQFPASNVKTEGRTEVITRSWGAGVYIIYAEYADACYTSQLVEY